MLENLHWGFPVIGYLFLAGLGAGAATVSASVLLRTNGATQAASSFNIARIGALIAPFPVIVGTGLLVFELGSFQAGHFFKFINLFMIINLSPMSIGSWLLLLFVLVSLGYAYTFLAKDAKPGDPNDRLRTALAWVMVPLGIGVAVYTGVLLGAMPARPFWNSPVLAMLFLLSSLSTGVAAILLVRAVLGRGQQGNSAEKRVNRDAYLLTASDILLIGFEILVVFLFVMFAHLTIGNVKEAVAVILGGSLTTQFWFGVVVLGLVLPAIIELKYVIPTLLHHKEYAIPRNMEILISAVVLVGGFLLRYVVVMAGQITGPIGI